MSKRVITVIKDIEGDGGQVLLDGENVQMGPAHDFYPMCWGITEYGTDWRCIGGLVVSMVIHFGTQNVTVVRKKGRWDFNGVIHEIEEA